MTTVPSEKMGQMELISGATDPVPKQDNARKAKEVVAEYLPPNIAQPVKAKVPDFSDPNRPSTCLARIMHQGPDPGRDTRASVW